MRHNDQRLLKLSFWNYTKICYKIVWNNYFSLLIDLVQLSNMHQYIKMLMNLPHWSKTKSATRLVTCNVTLMKFSLNRLGQDTIFKVLPIGVGLLITAQVFKIITSFLHQSHLTNRLKSRFQPGRLANPHPASLLWLLVYNSQPTKPSMLNWTKWSLHSAISINLLKLTAQFKSAPLFAPSKAI